MLIIGQTKEIVIMQKLLNKFNLFKKKPEIKIAPVKTKEELELEAKNKEAEKVKLALKNLKALQDLWINLEWSVGNRVARKQFRREFINNDKFADDTIQKVIKWHEQMLEHLQKPTAKEAIKDGQ